MKDISGLSEYRIYRDKINRRGRIISALIFTGVVVGMIVFGVTK
jgi:hypothetical protein